jgi:putative copper export protein
MQRLATFGLMGTAATFALASVLFASAAYAQHSHVGAEVSAYQLQVQGSVTHGVVLTATALLGGLAPFAVLVWLPASKATGIGRDALWLFGYFAPVLLYVLAVAGVGELAVYAMRASGEPFSTGLFREALLDTRVGQVWIARLTFGLLTAGAIFAASRMRRTFPWWVAVGASTLLLMTLTSLSHAAAEEGFLPFFADWLHVVAASLWMGGLLGFIIVFLGGPLETVPDERTMLRHRAVRRFSGVATVAVAVLLATGFYAVLLHVPSIAALVETPYGRALLVKLGFAAVLLVVGGANFVLAGRGPFERLLKVELAVAIGVFAATGFLTSLPPARAVWHEPAVPTVAPASAEEQAARAEANCRLATYIAEQNFSRREANEFSDLLANMEETMKNLYSTKGALRNAALDHLGVLRYAECKAEGE